MDWIISLFIALTGIIVTILLIVGIHELGHFLAARACGIKVLRFSIGFGKVLYRWYDKKGTEYVFSLLPLGGYVQMLDETEGNVSAAELPYAFNRQPIYKKFIVVVMGPLANLLFAFALYWLLFVIGFSSAIPVIGKVAPNSIAAQAGLAPQQEIVKINNENTRSWMSVLIKLMTQAGNKDTMTFDTKQIDSQIMQNHSLDLTNWRLDDLRPDPLESLGITPYSPVIPAVVGKVISNQSGLQSGDKIISINEKKIQTWFDAQEQIYNHPGQTKQFVIERNGKKIKLPITIGTKHTLFNKYGFLGIAPQYEWPKKLSRDYKYGALAAISPAWNNLKDYSALNFIMIGKMLTGQVSLQSLGGPITIFENAGTALHQGFVAFIGFLAFLSISIGIINILPIPGLDGGHMLFQLIEAVIGKPISQRVQLLFLRLGLIVLFLLLTQALVNDIMRI